MRKKVLIICCLYGLSLYPQENGTHSCPGSAACQSANYTLVVWSVIGVAFLVAIGTAVAITIKNN